VEQLAVTLIAPQKNFGPVSNLRDWPAFKVASPTGKSRLGAEPFDPAQFAPCLDRPVRERPEYIGLLGFLARPDRDDIIIPAIGAV
jgi:hypothetical protein